MTSSDRILQPICIHISHSQRVMLGFSEPLHLSIEYLISEAPSDVNLETSASQGEMLMCVTWRIQYV